MLKIFLLFAIPFITFSQNLTTEEIKAYAESMNKDLPYSIPGTKVIMDNISSFGRNLIFTYKVPEDWYPFDNIKEELINAQTEGFKKQLSSEKINLIYNYSRNGNIIKNVRIAYTDFNIPVIGSLGEYRNYKSHPKSKGINIKIKDPLGFEYLEGDRPSIIKKFNNKLNNLVYLFGVNEMPFFMTKDYVRSYIFNEESASVAKVVVDEFGGVYGESNLVSSKYIDIDRQPALQFVYDLKTETITGDIEMRTIMWVVYYEDRLIFFSGTSKKENFDKHKYIFYLITNSVVFLDQYEKIGINKKNNDVVDFNEYVEKFYRELTYFGINKIRPKHVDIKLKPLDVSAETYHYHGYSTGYNNDDVVEIVLNERSWRDFTKAQKHYLIFHELCHDILNLDDLKPEAEEKNIMYPSINDFKVLTMDDFIENFHNLLEKY